MLLLKPLKTNKPKIVQKESILSRSNSVKAGHQSVYWVVILALKSVKLVNSYWVFSGFGHLFHIVLFQRSSSLRNKWGQTVS